MWAQVIVAAIGIWLELSAAVLGYSGSAAADNDHIVGPFVACFAVVSWWEATRGVRLWNLPLGLWLVVAAFVLPYPIAGTLSVLASGAAIAALSLVKGQVKGHFGGGWRTLWQRDPYDVRSGSAERPANPSGTR